MKNFLQAAFTEDWLSKHFLLENLDKQFDAIIQEQSKKIPVKKMPAILDPEKDIRVLEENFRSGGNVFKLVLPEYFDYLCTKKLVNIDQLAYEEAWRVRMNQLTGSNQRKELDLLMAYQSRNPEHELIKADSKNLTDLAKRISVINYFKSKQKMTA